ncbi:hypothetical protein [Caulobacter sp. 17J65-9]|uniref:hypothetical protein n=1 Tax=Caulobacter sp. 17J65-9 TaxID=2709382 RepID=UPI0013C651DA|nr:hypothetical protein [Caulobacter sp. 17J65-9]NEX92720.1 hypothetical protein [Caulobacter sp. 17J65-9]
MAAVVMAAGAASAKAPDSFNLCDGYDAPTTRGDGVSFEAKMGGLFATYANYIVRRPVDPKASGVAACTAALADPKMKPEYWMRRASLLRARALHQLAGGDRAAALADLDQAYAQAPDPADLYFRRGMGAGIDLVRALVLRLGGDQAGAEALALKVFNERPYSSLAVNGAMVAAGPDARWETLEPMLKRFGELDPVVAELIFQSGVVDGRLQDTPELRSRLMPPEQLQLLGSLLPDAETQERMPPYREITPIDSEQGYISILSKKREGMVVRAFGNRSSILTAQEMSLLRAAELARFEGKRGLLILQRQDYIKFDAPNPQDARSDIQVVFTSQTGPEAKVDKAWRVMDADAIYLALSPLFPPKDRR